MVGRTEAKSWDQNLLTWLSSSHKSTSDLIWQKKQFMLHLPAPHLCGAVHTEKRGEAILHSPLSDPQKNKSNCRMGIMQPNTSAAATQRSDLHSTGIAGALKIACAGCAFLHARNPFLFSYSLRRLRESRHLKRNSLLLLMFFSEPI